MTDIFSPSKYQESIFEWILTGSGNAVVNAVAGAGKTTTLIEATKYIKGRRVLFAAFNKHIVSVLKDRVDSTTTCKTIHSIGFGALYLKLGRRQLKTKEFKYRTLCRAKAREILQKLKLIYDDRMRVWLASSDIMESEQPEEPPTFDQIFDQLIKLVDLSRCTLTDATDLRQLEKLVTHFDIPCTLDLSDIHFALQNILEVGEQLAIDSGEIDYTDMIWLPNKLNIKLKEFDWILVDESQDLNAAQLGIVLKMKGPSTRILFVGDPQQAIYGFSGADSQSFNKIKEITDADEFPLSICYRCPKKVVEHAKELVPQITANDESRQGSVVRIPHSNIIKVVKEKDLILSRATEPLVKLCLSLIANRIKASIVGKDIGKSLVSIILEVEKTEGFDFKRFLEFLHILRENRIRKLKSKSDTERQIIDLEDQIASIETCYTSFNVNSVAELCNEINTIFDNSDAGVTLCTIHRAKGLEEERVFILDYDRLPLVWENQKEWQLEQEQNLKYVAITRAKHKLHLIEEKPVT